MTNESSNISINTIRQAAVVDEFAENIGQRTLILLPQFPFLIVGEILEVVSDYVMVRAEITNITELDNEEFRVHIDEIDVFYIETDEHHIPDIRMSQDD